MSEPALDLSNVTPEDAPEFTIPDHTASRSERRSFASYIAGQKEKTEERTRGRRQPKKPVSRAKKGAFTEPLSQMYTMAGMAVFVRDQHCGTAIMEAASGCAEALDELAYRNESVRRALDALVKTSTFGAVIAAHLPIVLAVAGHHGGGKMPFVPSVVPDFSEADPEGDGEIG